MQKRLARSKRGVTLIELLVVITIIGILLSLLMPGVMAIRETARRMKCGNNLRQIGMAIMLFHDTHGKYPSSWRATEELSDATFNGWSVHAQILPYLEQEQIEKRFDFEHSFEKAGDYETLIGKGKLTSIRIGTYVCPSEIDDRPRRDSMGREEFYPLTYASNLGDWYVHDECANLPGQGAFRPRRGFKPRDITDGLSTTVAMAEVKAFTPCFLNAGLDNPAIPTPGNISSLGGTFYPFEGHTKWVDGRVHQTGFTAVFTPNTKAIVNVGGRDYDVDWTNQVEGSSHSTLTYAAITSRSYHRNGVQVLMMGGNVHFIANQIDAYTWRALCTRNGREPNPRPPR